MSLRARLTLAGGGAVFVALAIASLVIYFSVRSKLHDQIDASLIQTVQKVTTKVEDPKAPTPGPVLRSDGSGYFQVIPSFGAATKAKPRSSSEKLRLKSMLYANSFVPLQGFDSLVATGHAPPNFRDVSYHGVAMRLYTTRLSLKGDGLVRAAQPLTAANATIARVRWLLIGLTLGGALAAGLLGRLAAAAVLRPVRTLAEAARDVTTTRDLNQRITVDGRDELASLAENFNEMLAALEESQRAQQQLIADASHELRTPLTAHRANVELLARPDLPAERRPHVLSAAVRGIEELSTLVSDLIQAARNGRPVDARTPVALDKLVEAAVERAKHRAPGVRFETQIAPYTLSGAPARLERAIDNVLDNAAKWSPAEGTIEVNLGDGVLTVRDHGAGIDEADLPHVFDRFYRSAAARGLPGSGLGLAIVKQTVDDHGGSASVTNAGGGGVEVSLRFDAATRSLAASALRKL